MQSITQGKMHALKVPDHQRDLARKKRKTHQDSEIKKDTTQNGVCWMISKR
jgi:hypothetical protein